MSKEKQVSPDRLARYCWVWKRSGAISAAHHLPDYKGACARVHGHNYVVEIGVWCEVDPKTGMGIDMKELQVFLKLNVEALFDHQDLNEALPAGTPTTAEELAFYLLEQAKRVFERPVLIRVFETDDSWVEATA